MRNQSKILFTGGSGKLGTEMKKLLPKALYPDSKVFDVTKYGQMENYVKKHKPKIIIHAAAYTLPQKAETEPIKPLEANHRASSSSNLAEFVELNVVYLISVEDFTDTEGDFYVDVDE